MSTRFHKLHPRRLLLGGLIALSSLAIAADRSQIQEVGYHLMCVCGCHQVLSVCNMISCPSAVPMREEIGSYLDAGMNKDQILTAFVDKYSISVLSAPPATGVFNISAWIMPFAALLAGALIVVYFIRHWKTPAPDAAGAQALPVDPSKYSRELEEELRRYTPED